MTQFILATFAAFYLPSISSAAAPDCGFVARQDAAALMEDLSDEVIGWTSCYEKFPNLGAFTVARFHVLKDKSLNDFLIHLARQLVPDEIETVIVGEQKDDASHRQVMIRSKRNNGKFQWQYVFTGRAKDGSIIVFVHSGNQEDTLANESSLHTLRAELTAQKFLSQII